MNIDMDIDMRMDMNIDMDMGMGTDMDIYMDMDMDNDLSTWLVCFSVNATGLKCVNVQSLKGHMHNYEYGI
jgi:hypothetical protein